MPSPADLTALPLEELRARRSRVRSAAELARLRSRQAPEPAADALRRAEDLESQAAALTDELIARYAADLGLVDSLLDEPYPAKATGRG